MLKYGECWLVADLFADEAQLLQAVVESFQQFSPLNAQSKEKNIIFS